MFTLTTGGTLKGKAGTATAITYTIFGDVVTTTDAFQTLGQGQLATSTGDLLTTTPVPAATSYLVKQIQLANATGSDVTGIVFYVNGSAAANQITGTMSIPANGTAVYADGIWSIYSASGILLTTIGGAAGGDLTGSYPNPTVKGINNVTLSGLATGLLKNTTGTGVPSIASGSDIPTTPSGSAVGTGRAINTTAPITGGGDLSADRTIAISDATYTVKGALTAAEKIELNSIDGRTNAGATPRVFRPGDYMQGNTYDPTGTANSTTAFSAMMTAIRAHNDRFAIQLTPGVFKIDHDILASFGTNNPAFSIIGPGRGCCILLPNSAPATAFSAMITLNRGTTGSDAVTIRGFTIYNTSGTVYTQGAGILTNGADGVDISEVGFIDLYRDIQVSGQPYTMTTTGGSTALTVVSPSFVAADVGKPISGVGLPNSPAMTLVAQAGTSGTLSANASTGAAAVRYLDNTIKCSIQKTVHFNTNAGASNTSVGILVDNGLAGDTYMGPDIVMSDGGATTRREACIRINEAGHYEITQANLTGSQRGIFISPGISQIVAFGFHTNVLCDSNTVNGMNLLASVSNSVIKNIKSVNSWYSGTTVVNGSAAAAGVVTGGASGSINGVTFTTDRFLNNRTHGFEHAKGTDFRWSDCDMKGNSSVGSAQADGLNVAAAVSNWSINGGKYGGTDTLPTAGNQRYGINVAAGAGDNIKISPDDLTGNVTGPLSNGATGASVFVNGCPGLTAPYARGASGAAIGVASIVVAETLIPKNSVRVGTVFRLTTYGQQITAANIDTFTARLKATSGNGVGNASTGTVIATAATVAGAINDWVKVEFMMTVAAITASGQIQGHGSGVKAQLAFGTAVAARASGVGFLAMDTTADQYLQLVATPTAASFVPHNSTIEVVSY